MAFTHFDLSDRIVIQTGIKNGESFKAIAEKLGKHPTSVANEVKRHLLYVRSGGGGMCFNDCAHRMGCKKTNLCHGACYKHYCRSCTMCRNNCPEYEKDVCDRLSVPPYTCDGCKRIRGCSLEKSRYDAGNANDKSSVVLHESRSGINTCETDIATLNEVIVPKLKQGQSLYHIRESSKDIPMPSLRTLYSYVENKVLGACSLDLPRKVKYRPRRKNPVPVKKDRACRIGRTYSDFNRFMEENPDTAFVEMDSVVDRDELYSLLTLHFPVSHFMLAYIRHGNTAGSVADIFDSLTDDLGTDGFRRLFPVILTDNGSEFSDPARLERTRSGGERTKVFYCDPGASWQKAAIENNHELIRRILPKGTSFKDIGQGQVRLMMDHVNSYKRRKLNGRCPYDVFSLLYGAEVLHALDAAQIAADMVTLSPRLISNK